MKCPNCNTENRPKAKFCDECGFPLTGAIARVARDAQEDEAGQTAEELPDPDKTAILETLEDAGEEAAEAGESEDPGEPEELAAREEYLVEVVGAADEGPEEAGEPGEAGEATEAGETPEDDVPGDDQDRMRPDATVDLSGLDLDSYREDLASPVWRTGDTMELPRIAGAEQPKGRDYLASQKAAKARRRKGPLVAAAVVVIAAMVAFATYQMQLWGGVEVPDVVGMTQADATAVLQNQGFAVRATQVKSDDTEGLVLVMDPSARSREKEGGEVVIHISTARTVPDVIDKKSTEAQELMDAEGFENVKFVKQRSAKPEGTVVGVEPAVGERAMKDTEITVKIAEPFKVPDVSSMYLEDAQKALADAGFESDISYVYSEDYADGLIIGTEPTAGSIAEEGTTVYILISRSRGAELEALAYANLAPGNTVSIGMYNYEIVSLDSAVYQGDNTVSFSGTAKPYVSAFGETLYFSETYLTGQIVFNDANEVVGIY